MTVRLNLIDRLYLLAQRAATGIREAARWRQAVVPGGRPAVFFGYDHLSGPETPMGGGLVKSQILARAFPNHPRGANLLYLISSALPVGAVAMAGRARRSGVKVVLNQNGVGYPAWCGRHSEETNRPLRALYREADLVLFQSQFARKSADAHLGPRSGPSELMYNAVDTRWFTPGPDWPRPKLRRLLLAGSHHDLQRVECAVAAVSELRRRGHDLVLCIAGRLAWKRDPDAARKQLHEVVHHHGVSRQVEVVGPYAQSDAASLYRSCDLLIHTQYNDVCPGVVLEAMACGLPVVYSASGGVPELVDATSGAGVPVELDWHSMRWPDASALADAAELVMKDVESCARSARRRAADFDVEPWIAGHGDAFRRLLEHS